MIGRDVVLQAIGRSRPFTTPAEIILINAMTSRRTSDRSTSSRRWGVPDALGVRVDIAQTMTGAIGI
jgi:hypothetical protein